jgi:Arc/MetJ family transcription regulator
MLKMRTTLNIKDEVMEKLIEITGATNKSQAVNQALEAFLREKQVERLLNLRGKLNLEENWTELRELELDEK